MATPLDLITRLARPARRAPSFGRCPVCRQDVRDGDLTMTIRGGLHVHRSCATYRMRQRPQRPPGRR
jgi:hypothetical protein